jgi:hypothetical protein
MAHSLFLTDTHHTQRWTQSNRWSRSTLYCQCSTTKRSNIALIVLFILSPTYYFTQTLTTLALHLNQISNQGAQHLANALQNNQVTPAYHHFLLFHSLSHIDTHYTSCWVQWNRWSRSTTSRQCPTTKQSNIRLLSLHLILSLTIYIIQTLTTLDVEWNQISNQGAQHLVNALQQNKVTFLSFLLLFILSVTHYLTQTFTTLELWGNQIDDDGIRHLMEILNDNPGLKLNF